MAYIDKRVTDYIDGLYRPQSAELGGLRLSCEKEGIPVIFRETENYLASFLRSFAPKRILEIGTAHGYSACVFAEVLKDSSIVTIERDKGAAAAAVSNITELGYDDRIKTVQGDAVAVLAEMKDHRIGDPDEAGPFDFVFIDAGKSHYREYLDGALPLCSLGAVIVCDNIFMHGMLVSPEMDPKGKHSTNIRRMNEFVSYISSDDRFDSILLSTGDGLAVIRLRDNFAKEDNSCQ